MTHNVAGPYEIFCCETMDTNAFTLNITFLNHSFQEKERNLNNWSASIKAALILMSRPGMVILERRQD